MSLDRAWRLTLWHRDSVLADAASIAFPRFVDLSHHWFASRDEASGR